MKTLAEEWASYEQSVLPATAGETQRRETRRGFYAGAQSFLMLMSRVQSDDISDDQGAEMIEVLHRELQDFSAAVRAGRA